MRIGQDSHLFNAEIRSRRQALGLSQDELGLKIGYSSGTIVSQAESLRITSSKASVIKKLALFFGVQPAVLCPAWLVLMDGVPKRTVRIENLTKRFLEHKVAEGLLAIDSQATITPVDLDRDLLVEAVREVIPDLTPIEQEVVCLNFGLSGRPEKTLKEIEAVVKRNGVKQILNRATQKLRSNKRLAKRLRYFYDTSTRRVRRLGHVLGEPDNKSSFYLPENEDDRAWPSKLEESDVAHE